MLCTPSVYRGVGCCVHQVRIEVWGVEYTQCVSRCGVLCTPSVYRGVGCCVHPVYIEVWGVVYTECISRCMCCAHRVYIEVWGVVYTQCVSRCRMFCPPCYVIRTRIDLVPKGAQMGGPIFDCQ